MRRGLVLFAVLIAGCGVGPGEERSAELLVTRNFGDTQIGRGGADGTTVLRALQRRFDVKTRYGGNFVQSIQGVKGGGQADWFFYVNGIESDEGAGTYEISPGDRVWWDHHYWRAAMRIPAVVGSFPEPFLSGHKGERYPVRVDCAPSADDQCDQVLERLRAVGVSGAAKAGFGQPVGLETLRVLVGEWSEIRSDAAAARLEEGPELSGVFARFADRGAKLELLSDRGEAAREGEGLVAATVLEDQAPTWVVTGVDAAGVEAAAGRLSAEDLGGHFAVAVADGEVLALPITELEW